MNCVLCKKEIKGFSIFGGFTDDKGFCFEGNAHHKCYDEYYKNEGRCEERERILKEYEEYIKAKREQECDEKGLDRRKEKDCDKSVGLVLRNMFLLESVDWLKDVLEGKEYDAVESFCKIKKEMDKK